MDIRIREWLGRAWAFALDTIAPPDPEIRRIESFDLPAFAYEISREPRLPESDGVICLFPYRAPVMRKALVELKEFENRKIARLIGTLVYDALIEEAADLETFEYFVAPMIVPVPMTPRKRRERGWNQCELILDGFREADGEHIFEVRADVLAKTRETDDQVGMTRAERFENQRGCFAVPERACASIRGRNVIVIDDIVTTGATLAEARRALLEAGAQSVVRVAIAH